MPYTYLEDIATADVGFRAWGESREDMLTAAAEATMNVMVDDLASIQDQLERSIIVEAESLEMLLFELLQEIIYHKDAEQLLLRLRRLVIEGRDGHYTVFAQAYGEPIDVDRHALKTDVKAVTMHRFSVRRTVEAWEATVVLDI